MAIIKQLDPELVGPVLAAWLTEQLPDADTVTLTDVSNPSAGASSETLMLDAIVIRGRERRREGYVARVEPAGERVLYTYDLEQEARIMRAVGEGSAVPVPEVIGYEPDPSVLGAPFLVMRRIDGRVPPDSPPFTLEGWLLDLQPAERARLHDNALRTLAEIHAIDWQQAGLADIGRPELGEAR